MSLEEIKYPKQKVFDPSYCEKIVAQSIEKVEGGGVKIGFGKTANILVSETDSKICMKAVQKEAKDKRISCNDVEVEMFFLDILSLKGYRVPKPVCSVKTEKNDYLFMETVGTKMSVKNLLENEDSLSVLPPGFDFERFFAILREEVKNMNERERVYHRDLHAGNIMIDKDGNPVIVDFGDAKILYISGEDPYKYTDGRGKTTIYTDDNDNVAQIRNNLGEMLRKRGWFNKKQS